MFEDKKQATVKEDIACTGVNRANEYLQSGDAQHAVDFYRQAIVEDPKKERAYRYNLALALDRLGDIAEEREVLQQAIQLDPSLRGDCAGSPIWGGAGQSGRALRPARKNSQAEQPKFKRLSMP